MKIGLLGFTGSGKSTIYNALTNSDVDGYKKTENRKVVDVFDERIKFLSDYHQPKRTLYAKIEFVDLPGVAFNPGEKNPFESSFLNKLSENEAICVVLKNFSELDEKVDPLGDLVHLRDEFILSDLTKLDNRLERIAKNVRMGLKEYQVEEKVLKRLTASLNENEFPNGEDLQEEEIKMIKGFQLLTLKPVFAVLNSSEDNFGQNQELLEKIREVFPVIEIAGKFEYELNQLEDDEKLEFMEEIGIQETAINRFTRFSFDTLGLIDFFTVGKDEVRAWTIKKGSVAVEAADKIHSDIARGFIKAETYAYQDFVDCGSESELKARKLIRLESKHYVVQDGDIINFKFNV